MAAAAEEWSLMRHHTVTVGVELKQYGEQKVVEVSLKDDVIERFSLGLVLLREQVVDTLSLVGKSTRLDIRVADEQHVDLPADNTTHVLPDAGFLRDRFRHSSIFPLGTTQRGSFKSIMLISR